MPYMGPAPELTYQVDPLRFADSIACVIRDLRRPSPHQLQWLVGVVTCPFCDQRHEHPVSSRSGWGWFRPPCSGAAGPGYYLTGSVS
jgi:hypothetical protein